MRQHDGEHAYLESRLEQRFSTETPPDLSAQILARARRDAQAPGSAQSILRRSLIAASVLLGIGAVIAVSVLDRRAKSSHQEMPTQETEDPEPKRSRITPRSVDDIRRLISIANGARVHFDTIPEGQGLIATGQLPAQLLGEPLPSSAPLRWNPHCADQLANCLDHIENKPKGVRWKCQVDLLLPNLEFLTLTIHITAQEEWGKDGHYGTLEYPGVGCFAMDIFAFTNWGCDIGEAAEVVRGEQGIIHHKLLQSLETSLSVKWGNRLRGHELTIDDLDKVPHRDQVTTADLRYSPEIHVPDALHRLSSWPLLDTLTLDSSLVYRPELESLSALPHLRRLIFAGRGSDPMFNGPVPASTHIGDESIDALLRHTELKELVVHGNTISPAGIRRLAQLEHLELLDLSYTQTITGESFEAFASHLALKTVHLNHCTNLSDKGIAAIANIPRLETLSLNGVRSELAMPAPKGPAKEGLTQPHDLTPNSLVLLAQNQHLRRLDLGKWFASKSPFQQTNKRSVLPGPWQEAFGILATSNNLEVLSLAYCSDLTLEDITVLCASRNLKTVILRGVVGRSTNATMDHVGVIPFDAAAGLLHAAIPGLAIIVSNSK